MSEFKPPTEDQLEHRYKIYLLDSGDPIVRDKVSTIHRKVKELATAIVSFSPCSPEQSRALNALDEVLFLTRAAMDRNV